MHDVPAHLRHRPFATTEAEFAGLPRKALSREKQFRALFRGIWIRAELELTLRVWLQAALFVLPADVVVSHTTALALLGVGSAPERPLHFSTNTDLRCRQDGIVLHRRQGQLHTAVVDGIPVVGPDRAFVDSATLLGYRDLVRAGDTLIRLGHTTPERLRQYAEQRHLDGVIRARRAARDVRAGVDAVSETDTRLLLRFARLPEPEVNGWIINGAGIAIARADLVYRAYRVLVEYDGWHHERDARQRQKDHLRRERLDAAGWTVIVITAEDMKNPLGIVRRVHAALVARGYRGPTPVMSATWHRWFEAA
jgi:very-short-patch-repair endonuclease